MLQSCNTRLVINTKAIESNYKLIREKLQNKVKILAVVKANAYGFGAKKISKFYEGLGVSYLGCSTINEACSIRKVGVKTPILVFGYVSKKDVIKALKNKITLSIVSYQQAKDYSEIASQKKEELKVHIVCDVGLARMGIQAFGKKYDDAICEIKKILSLPMLNFEGIYTHFSSAEENSDEAIQITNEQFNLFNRIIKDIREKIGKTFLINHCGNSGIIKYHLDKTMDMVRVGSLLLGYENSDNVLNVKPCSKLLSKVIMVKQCYEGDRIGYSTKKLTQKTNVAIFNVGYADGLFHNLEKLEYSFDGHKNSACVSVCMDYLMLTDEKKELSVGDEIELFGDNISIYNFAKNEKTIPEDIFCKLSSRIKRIYK